MAFDRITFDPQVMGGKPCIRGMRVTVNTILGLLAAGHSSEQILEAYPYLEEADIREALSYAAWRVEEIRGYQHSRMGIYEHRGFEGAFVRLRELVTGDDVFCHPTNQYQGAKGELWYVRLCPPMAELGEGIDYHITMTTPYVLINTRAEDWTAYLKQNLDSDQPTNEALHDFLKYGPSLYHWHEFVFGAFSKHESEAIFLTGLPDVKDSLPHAS
jgi:uncharacterized protein (DUF433 family)